MINSQHAYNKLHSIDYKAEVIYGHLSHPAILKYDSFSNERVVENSR